MGTNFSNEEMVYSTNFCSSAEMIEAKKDLTATYRLAKTRIDLANAIEGGLAVEHQSLTLLTLKLKLKEETSWVL